MMTEGDMNLSQQRNEWNESITNEETRYWLELDSRYFIHQAMSTPCLEIITQSNGSKLHTATGQEILDFHGNNVHQLGFGNPYVITAVVNALTQLPFSPRRYTNKYAVLLAEKLSSLLPGTLNRSLFAPGGTEVVGIALKLARRVTGKFKVITFYDSFHGASLDAISAGGEEVFQRYMGPLLPGIIRMAPPWQLGNGNQETGEQIFLENLSYVLRKEGDVGALIAETIRNTGIRIPSPGFWRAVKERCEQYGTLLILDEIPLSPARTGKMFALEHYHVEPDIVCLGKGLGGGIFPIAAMVTRDEYNIASDISLGHYTHEKSPAGSAAALAVFRYIEEHSLLNMVQEKGKWFTESLCEMSNEVPGMGEVRSIGLLAGVPVLSQGSKSNPDAQRAEQIMYHCLKQGLSFKISDEHVIQLSPPLTATYEELTHALSILRKAFLSC